MNSTQKGAWSVLVISISFLAFVVAIIILLRFDKMSALRIVPQTFFILSLVMMGLSLVFMRRKQSPAEVNYDERDLAIKRKALLASHITLWILIFLGYTIPFAITDQRGTFPVSVLPIALFIISITDLLVYSLTILIQYGRSGDGNK